ncbi:hypothetical protein [Agrobacterium pusense]|uniref:hypothetical protein n=1 Tax=Agrobacterium pusense TaxID=648995 RepID=UPI002F3FDDBF
MPLATEELRRRADAYKEHGTLKKAAAALGIKKSALSESQRWLGLSEQFRAFC